MCGLAAYRRRVNGMNAKSSRGGLDGVQNTSGRLLTCGHRDRLPLEVHAQMFICYGSVVFDDVQMQGVIVISVQGCPVSEGDSETIVESAGAVAEVLTEREVMDSRHLGQSAELFDQCG